MKKKKKYTFGWEEVTIKTEPGYGGYFMMPNNVIVIRLSGTWEQTVAVFLHEAMEWQMSRNKSRFNVTEDLGKDVHSYMFMMSHPVFSDCCAKVAELWTECEKDLKRVWKKEQK